MASTVLFPGPPGKVLALEEPGVQGVLPALVKLPNFTFASRKCIITRVTLGLETSQQFMHTLGGDIYIYVFGDRIGQLTISGLAFAYDCDGDGASGGAGGGAVHGIIKAKAWYEAYKLSTRRVPVDVSLGTAADGVLRGYLSNFQADVVRPELRLMSFAFNFFVLPEKPVPSGGMAVAGASA